jgi:DNA mismatch endonuclease (patch repair protein)
MSRWHTNARQHQESFTAMDTLTVAQRSERMARIRSKDTQPELAVRRIVHSLGYRYQLHRKDLAGAPDLVFPGRKKAIFVNGCFWHAHQGCAVANRPKSRTPFWDEKFKRNKNRDKKNANALRRAGWGVATIWECEAKSDSFVRSKVSRFLGPNKKAPHGHH